MNHCSVRPTSEQISRWISVGTSVRESIVLESDVHFHHKQDFGAPFVCLDDIVLGRHPYLARRQASIVPKRGNLRPRTPSLRVPPTQHTVKHLQLEQKR